MNHLCAAIIFFLLPMHSTHAMDSGTSAIRSNKRTFSDFSDLVITLPDGSKLDIAHYIKGEQIPSTDQEATHIKQAIRVLHQQMQMRYQTALQLFQANQKDSIVCYQLLGALMKQHQPGDAPLASSIIAELEAAQLEQEASIETIKMLTTVLGQQHPDLAHLPQD